MSLKDYKERYQKQLKLPQIGEEGQQILSNSHVLIIGCGGLGAIAAVYLAGAGIGKLTIIDHDYPELSNIHRQVFFTPNNDEPKVVQLKKHLNSLNPSVQVIAHDKSVDKNSLLNYMVDADVVFDCTDDLYTKYLINDACVVFKKALVYAAIHQVDGYAFLYNPETNSANLRHFFPEISEVVIPNCSDAGVYNVMAGMFGLIQANEAIKYLLELNGRLENKMMVYNALTYEQQFIIVNTDVKIDISSIWNSESYKSKGKMHELDANSLDDFLKQKNVKVISLIEEWEEEEPIADATHLAAGDFLNWDYTFSGNKKYLIYCQQGKQSELICSKLLEKFPSFSFYTLKGGRKVLNKSEVS